MLLNQTITDLFNFAYKFLDKFSHTYTRQILVEALALLNQLWPYLVAGIIFSTTIKLFISKENISKFFTSKQNYLSIVGTAILGVISPLGSYITIPVSAALFTVGVPLPFLVSFMVSSPIINPNLFILTAGAFSMQMAIARVVAAILLGSAAGFITQFLLRKKWFVQDDILKSNSESFQKWLNQTPDISWKAYFTDLFRMTLFVSRYFFIAIFVAALIKISINPNWISPIFTDNLYLSVIISTGAGIPFYVCGGAAIPVVQQLAALGLGKGAVLAYFISGPATKIATLVVLYGTFKKKILAIYLSVGIVGAFLLGVLFELVQ